MSLSPADTRPPVHRRLSVRLLLFTALFVLVAEVFIFIPSIARFRLDFLTQRLAEAHLVALAIEDSNQTGGVEAMGRRLMNAAGVIGISVKHMGLDITFGTDPDLMQEIVESTQITGQTSAREVWQLIQDALRTMLYGGGRVIQVIGLSPIDNQVLVMVVMDDTELFAAMEGFARRIFFLSLIISAITAMMLYLLLDRMLIRPIRALTGAMVAFRNRPEDATLPAPIGQGRRDEIGLAGTELAAMQQSLRTALAQKSRLAALGTAVVKINHDLRNMLATASLLSERLAESADPATARTVPRLLASIDRAARLCEETLRYAREGAVHLRTEAEDLDTLLLDVEDELRATQPAKFQAERVLPPQAMVLIDRDQIARALANLARNAVEAGASRLIWTGRIQGPMMQLTLQDNGPGLPPRAKENLFQPFAGSARAGGTGLGLAIARDLVKAHGGDLWLDSTSAEGTTFRMTLPLAGPAVAALEALGGPPMAATPATVRPGEAEAAGKTRRPSEGEGRVAAGRTMR